MEEEVEKLTTPQKRGGEVAAEDKLLIDAIHTKSHTRKRAGGDAATANSAEARARLLAIAILKTDQDRFPHEILSKAQTNQPLMLALPLECEKLLDALDHSFFDGKRGAKARMLLDEEKGRPRSAEDPQQAAAKTARQAATEKKKAKEERKRQFGL